MKYTTKQLEDAIYASIGHWARMRACAETLATTSCKTPIRNDMTAVIGEAWAADNCALCKLVNSDCTYCPLYLEGHGCNEPGSVWHDMNNAGTWHEWLLYSNQMMSNLSECLRTTTHWRTEQTVPEKMFTKLPDPPAGEKWHNPFNMSAEQVGVDEGWRLLLVSEIGGNTPHADSHWCQGCAYDGKWRTEGGDYGAALICAYRTKEPLPTVNKLVFPEPQEDCVYHNPMDLTPEQVQVGLGWRLCYQSENCVKEDEYWDDDSKEWLPNQYACGNIYDCTRVHSLTTFRTKRPARVPQCFDAPPKGEAWHNPAKLTPEQVEVDKGWRLALVSEVHQGGPLKNKCNAWDERGPKCTWELSFYLEGSATSNTYRTKEPLPIPLQTLDKELAYVKKTRRPLTREEVYPWLRWNKEGQYAWYAIQILEQDGVWVHASSGTSLIRYSFQDLMNMGVEMSKNRLCRDWVPCYKVG